VATAEENAREALQVMRARWLADTGKTRAALEELQEELNLPALPQRIECYDISNIQGTSAVGSMVVFLGGAGARPIPTLSHQVGVGANDYAMLQEVLRRRFKRAAAAAPTHPEPVEGPQLGPPPLTPSSSKGLSPVLLRSP